MTLPDLLAVSRGEQPADLLLRNGRMLNVFSGQIEDADIVAISRTDLIDSKRLEQICTQLEITDQPLLLGKHHSSSIDLLVKELLSTDQEI